MATVAARNISVTPVARPPAKPFAPATGSWPSFRGAQAPASPTDSSLPDRWDAEDRREHSLAHAVPGPRSFEPVVWGNRVFVTSAVSSDPKATFRPGSMATATRPKIARRIAGCSTRSTTRAGKIVWERVAFEGAPLDKRHIKSTYASATPATDGRIVVAWFGSQGVYAYDVNGTLLWKVDLGRLDLGAYDIPTYEWGPASSPIIWNDLVILQCDTQADSFLLALDADDRQRRSGRPSATNCRRGARRRWRRRRRAPSS